MSVLSQTITVSENLIESCKSCFSRDSLNLKLSLALFFNFGFILGSGTSATDKRDNLTLVHLTYEISETRFELMTLTTKLFGKQNQSEPAPSLKLVTPLTSEGPYSSRKQPNPDNTAPYPEYEHRVAIKLLV